MNANQSSGKKGYISRYAINRNLLPEKVPCNSSKKTSEQTIVDNTEIELLPQPADLDGNRAKSPVARDNVNCNLAKGQTVDNGSGSNMTDAILEAMPEMWTPPVSDNTNVSGTQQIPLVPPQVNVQTQVNTSQPAQVDRSNVPGTLFPPPERHASLGPVMTTQCGVLVG